MVKTYIPLPNFSTAPPPGGPLHLGHVLKTLKPNDFLAPLNRKTRLAIDADADLLPLDTKHGYRTTRKELRSGNFGAWAQLASVFGVGIEGGVTYERGVDDVLTVEKLETSAVSSASPHQSISGDLTALKSSSSPPLNTSNKPSPPHPCSCTSPPRSIPSPCT